METVAVVGLGRVGLPLALSFADRGVRVIGVERQPAVLDQLDAGHMPFSETGTQELLDRVAQTDRFERTRAVQDAARADHIVLTLGTPSHVHIEIDMAQIPRWSTTCSRSCARATP
jgi:UDP-N-acetyl-D-mannosaminuronic acid dehydrogenase